MKIILAPDSFKESLSAVDVCRAMENGIRPVLPTAEIVHLPLADGGEGTVHTLVAATNGKLFQHKVVAPLGDEVTAEFGLLGDGQTAVIEMASASGLPLVPPDKRNPLNTTTYGTGQLIKTALDLNVNKIIIGIGGSATNECGAGMAQALGVRFYNANGIIPDFLTGGKLNAVRDVDISNLDPRLNSINITVACDVDNPLLGQRGASRVYGPQKGATPEIVDQLEHNMQHIINIIEAKTKPVRDIPGAGAAGGLGAGLMAFLNAELASGINTVLDACFFENHIKDADLILTGEGKIDAQSAMGKTIDGVLSRAQKYGVPVIAIGGSILDGAEVLYDKGLLCMFSICDRPQTLQSAMNNSAFLIEKTCSQIIRIFNMP